MSIARGIEAILSEIESWLIKVIVVGFGLYAFARLGVWLLGTGPIR